MLLIRTDANKQIGSGHLMRCLTIAEAADSAGIDTVFLTADEEAEKVLQERGRKYHILHTDFADMEEELPVLLRAVKECIGERKEKHRLLVDSYQITVPYMTALKGAMQSIEGAALILLEDYGDPSYPADIVINYNIYGNDFSYEKNAGRALTGCRYMPLRKEFTMQPCQIREVCRNVLITTGGSDPYRIALELVGRLHTKEEWMLHVVCGRFSESLESLLCMADTYPNLKVYSDVKRIWELMAECDAAVSASGTTLYELCAIGVPAVCFAFAENQILPGKTFGEKTMMTYAGDYRENKEGMFGRIENRLEALMHMTKTEREKISENLRSVTDGRGSERIIAEIF